MTRSLHRLAGRIRDEIQELLGFADFLDARA